MTGSVIGAETAEVAWVVCSNCREMLYGPRLTRNLGVCPECGHHGRLTARQRIEQLFDADSVEILHFAAESEDTLEFVDTKPYRDRLEQARRATGVGEGVTVVQARVGSHPVIAALMDFGFLGGSLGAAAGELITNAAEESLRLRQPLLLVTASGGARMQEGAISLMQMAKTSQALARLDEAGILTISLITDPTYGGVAASFATQCDVIVAEPGARLGFAGRRVIEQTIGHSLPAGFQTAEFLRDRGLIDLISTRQLLPTVLRKLLAVAAPPQQLSDHDERVDRLDFLVQDVTLLAEIDPWQAVQQARDLARPTCLDYIDRIFTGFEELQGDRMGGRCRAIVGGLASLGNRPVLVIGHQKGRTAAELTARNFGMPTPAGYRTAARLMRLAGKLGIAVITFIDTPGAYPGISAEEQGQAMAIADSIRLMASLPVPIVAVVIGEGGSGGALALAVANEVLISERGVYSVISPEGCASILFNDAAKAPTAARALKVDARSLLQMRIVDGVVIEPEGGSQADFDEAARRVASVLEDSLCRLDSMTPTGLVEARRARFRSFGSASQNKRLRAEL